MADYNCVSRTNYFRGKDVPAFKAWAKQRGLEIFTSEDHAGQFALAPGDDYYGAFPSHDGETNEDIDFVRELSAHLEERSVAVILEAGAEKLRYINGYAIAVNARGESVQLFLDDIYQLAAQAFPGSDITRAEY
ncbi:MAG: hypothetical protein QG602_140 [Verrucomicrobiota bacterium]|nr:hypothetical protein [Verrucomicrobiota bacterium]